MKGEISNFEKKAINFIRYNNTLLNIDLYISIPK